MSSKQFLKPDWRKIVISLIFFIITSFYNYLLGLDAPYIYGLPLPIYFTRGGWGQPPSFFFPGIITNFIFYYMISCLIIWIYNKVKKKK